jgi:sRNA-binding carbon storage regulator CsrA
MIVNLSAGDVIRVGDAVTLTVLAVESDLICFGLETPKRKSLGAREIGKDCDEADLKQRLNFWEWN